ncbi:hypothetical protein IWQ57_006708, partial [Coemansia nantahalensis]
RPRQVHLVPGRQLGRGLGHRPGDGRRHRGERELADHLLDQPADLRAGRGSAVLCAQAAAAQGQRAGKVPPHRPARLAGVPGLHRADHHRLCVGRAGPELAVGPGSRHDRWQRGRRGGLSRHRVEGGARADPAAAPPPRPERVGIVHLPLLPGRVHLLAAHVHSAVGAGCAALLRGRRRAEHAAADDGHGRDRCRVGNHRHAARPLPGVHLGVRDPHCDWQLAAAAAQAGRAALAAHCVSGPDGPGARVWRADAPHRRPGRSQRARHGRDDRVQSVYAHTGRNLQPVHPVVRVQLADSHWRRRALRPVPRVRRLYPLHPQRPVADRQGVGAAAGAAGRADRHIPQRNAQ